MEKKKRSWIFLVVSIIVGVLSILAILFISPDYSLSMGDLHLSIVYPFLLILFLFLFFATSYIINSKIHGVLLASFVVCYLLFRLNNLTHPLFLLLLVGICIVFELFFSFKM